MVVVTRGVLTCGGGRVEAGEGGSGSYRHVMGLWQSVRE